jgi:hypothetical protein
VAVLELVLGTHIEDCRRPGSQPIQQLVARYRLQLVPSAEIARHDASDLGAVPLTDPTQGVQQRDDRVFVRHPIEDPFPLAPWFDEDSAAKKLQVTRCVRHRQARSGSKIFDAPLALAEMFEQFKPMGVTERLGDSGETSEYALFRTEA